MSRIYKVEYKPHIQQDQETIQMYLTRLQDELNKMMVLSELFQCGAMQEHIFKNDDFVLQNDLPNNDMGDVFYCTL